MILLLAFLAGHQGFTYLTQTCHTLYRGRRGMAEPALPRESRSGRRPDLLGRAKGTEASQKPTAVARRELLPFRGVCFVGVWVFGPFGNFLRKCRALPARRIWTKGPKTRDER